MPLPYFTAAGETLTLDDQLRTRVRGEFVSCSAGVTQYELSGPTGGELVLLVGGLTIPLDYWDRLAAELHERGFRTLAYSGYGRGYSDRVQARYDETLFTTQIHDLLHTLRLTPAHVIGSSLGAVVTMAYARRHTAALRSVVIVGPAGLMRSRPLITRLLRIPLLGAILGAAFGQRLLQQHMSHNLRDPAATAELAAIVDPCYRVRGSMYALCSTITDFALTNRQNLYRAMRDTRVQTLLLWGEEDRVTPSDRWDEAFGLLHPRRAELIPQTGHMVSYERPHLTATIFTEFVATLERTPE
ncbi:pimeloyl-ACP methyl ester carboxylesterase [Microbacterium foliorum]|uniref:Pimeloyl-ACP methyl ester carboxylesterase n=1 Tax=Microbacterium foliorum TaxID=104336 RepID=A0ABU1HXQ2_9MICO|nr:alpha/beta hydrolase [Microbacterium foliorum]MDR6144034.1 pimeloyl-ACP methyl ester carboxylesterase [Microbacterium foliorum]